MWASPWLPPSWEVLLRFACREAVVPLTGQVYCGRRRL